MTLQAAHCVEYLQLVAQCMKQHYINRPSIESVMATLTKLNNADNVNSGTAGRDNLVCVIITVSG